MGSRDRDDEDYDDEPRSRPSRGGRGRFRCRYCGSTEVPVVKQKISTVGWIVFAVLLIFTIIFFWIGLLIKEEYRECFDCGMTIGS
jgi:hypothetical protein